GGHANHSLFWEIMCPASESGSPSGKLLEDINKNFGDFPTFKEKFSTSGVGRFGSGWVWLVVDGDKIAIMDTPNQDSPVSEGKTPILALDVWEHAYYLKYKNVRADYIAAWWNVVNWNKVNALYEEVINT
ncbi:MAG TPA: superoxide dismutase, partial [Patescibacteria group bacterium]|nr:superoxide dismutase [Patescibacteria group bacterium]